MSCQYKQLFNLFTRFLPQEIQSNQFYQAELEAASTFQVTDQNLKDVEIYLEALKLQKHYLTYYNVGIKRDENANLEGLANLVGLSLPKKSKID